MLNVIMLGVIMLSVIMLSVIASFCHIFPQIILHEVINPWGLYFKTFYGRIFWILVLSWRVCPWQAIPA